MKLESKRIEHVFHLMSSVILFYYFMWSLAIRQTVKRSKKRNIESNEVEHVTKSARTLDSHRRNIWTTRQNLTSTDSSRLSSLF
jgi:hypothetical protein